MQLADWLKSIGADLASRPGPTIDVRSPIDGQVIATVKSDTTESADAAIRRSHAAFQTWRDVPAPRRGELIRELGQALREHKEPLAQLVTLECGKIIEEGRGEVQEMIDICDFAVGLSRQLYGLTIASERPSHVMHENWHPLGSVGVISAFNFPVAVWSWNFALAIVCGDPVVWKPSEKTPLTALACQAIFANAARGLQDIPDGLSEVIVGAADIGQQLTDDARIALVSATGSTRMGGAVGPRVAQRFGKCLLELGGNNAVIVSDHADLDLAVPAIVFGAVGTSGQRCTTTRRVIAHRDIVDKLCNKLQTAYEGIAAKRIGDPREDATLIGPLIDQPAFEAMQAAVAGAVRDGGTLLTGGSRAREDLGDAAWYVRPALIRLDRQVDIVREETFAPILYVVPYDTLEAALEMHNAVRQGLSSAIFTTDLREAEFFKARSDCGIANVNIGTSGAEIGGAFGGEKETGGGRESGSDAWKTYMRRQTSTTYWGTEKPDLAQGIQFD
ncbi:MAG: aldehyde dehydrogenase family protein [Gammaproteobacteria bacterium]